MNSANGGLARILFVDDSRVMLRTAQKILSAEFDVITAEDGDDAWEQLERDTDIQVLFTDLNMPGFDGYELLEKVRTAEEPGLNNMPVIVVTGAEDDELARQKALDGGATDFISKPFTSTDLLARARAHAKYQRITRQLQAQCPLDPLTGLANKPGFLGRLQQDISYARRHHQDLTLMRVEIDDLVATFREHGNQVVDQLVMHVANLILTRIRKEDSAARIGLGDFAISLPGGHLDGIEAMAAYLHAHAAVKSPEVGGQAFPITLSTAVISAELDVWTNAEDALDRCEAVLDSARQRAAAPSARATVEQPQPAESDTTQLFAAMTEPESATAQTTPAHESLRLDPLLDQLKLGQTQEVIDKMPQVLQRLIPFLRLLGANQRALLIRFLQKLDR